MMMKYCPVCDKEQEIIIIEKQETYPVKGVDIEVQAHVCTCSVCHEEIWDPDLDDENLILAYQEYRKQKGLLAPEEIKAIRQSYGLSQTAFAKVLGLGEKTIARYENGSLQDEAQNNLIFLASDPVNFHKLYARMNNKAEDNFAVTTDAVYRLFNPQAVPYKYRLTIFNGCSINENMTA